MFDAWLRAAAKIPLLALAIIIGQRVLSALLEFMSGHEGSLLYRTFETASDWAMLLGVLSVGVMLLARAIAERSLPGG